ncbi:MAG: HAD-IIB family hydrolase, partial [Desulfobacterales bacterium]|nr:HAD-IIB family hydrolase [Desulfobacterales bacterium]
YIRKELLWPHLDEYVDKVTKFIRRNNSIPDIIHGHYPDAGYVANELSEFFGLPFIYTGHSLGRSKLAKLTSDGMAENDIIKKYKINQRIEAEEKILSEANVVIASTEQEVKEQYGLYHNKVIPSYKIVPPGIDIDKFYPFYHNTIDEIGISENAKYAQASILKELNRFFIHPEKPLILSLCRPDKRKNISGLIQAYGEDLELRTMANLAIFAGLRKDIDDMQENERDVLTNMLLLMDKYDLYGKMAIPKKHNFEYEVPALYRVAAEKHGVFVNPALAEPFGLTLLEASATGLPIVAPNDGGPVDIVRNCKNGILVDTTQPRIISNALRKIIADNRLWEKYSKSGIMNVRKHYTWKNHAKTYAGIIKKLIASNRVSDMKIAIPSDAIGRRLISLKHFLVADIDNTLIGGNNSRLSELISLLTQNKKQIGFGVATGRTIDSAIKILEKHNVPAPDIIISSVGSEIYYGSNHRFGQGWATHISHRWQRDKIVSLLKDFKFLTYQEEETQRKFKISYYMKPAKERLAKIHDKLLNSGCRYSLIYSHNQFLDILPVRASKGKAIRYLSYKWEIPLGHFLVCGDSGNDEEMLRGEPCGVVVGNYSGELERLRDNRRVYFAKQPYADGILEGLTHYRFIESSRELINDTSK